MELIAKPGPVDVPPTRPAPPVGTSFTDALEGAIGVATHHDGMSGSSRQDVADDYEQRISDGAVEAELGVAKALEKLTGLSDIAHCNCNGDGVDIAGDCLNISVCTHITGADEF